MTPRPIDRAPRAGLAGAAARRLATAAAALLAWLASACPVTAAPAVAVAPTAAAAPDAEAARLPAEIARALQAAAVPAAAAAFVVVPVDRGPSPVALSVHASVPLNPASTMKLVTTYAALGVLGPAHTWKTAVLAGGPIRAERLDGPLALKGSGDPALHAEDLWAIVLRLRGLGLREIAGDLLLDKSAFEAGSYETGTLDGNELRPYNAAPDPLLLNFKSVTFQFLPDAEARVVRVVALPPLAGLRVPPQVRASDGPCGDWRGRLQADFGQPLAPRFAGSYALSCGSQHWSVSLLDHTAYVGAVFRALWESAGGTWRGRARASAGPVDGRSLLVHESAPLAEQIRGINKYSNNVMTRQVFLALGAGPGGEPANPQRAIATIRGFYAARGLALPELVLENGSGLSRTERISAAGLAQVLLDAWASPVMPELLASLPVPGTDGTMRRRAAASGSAHVKTGLLSDVRAIAGYVLAASGRRYVVVALVNHPNASGAQPAHDALLQWIHSRG